MSQEHIDSDRPSHRFVYGAGFENNRNYEATAAVREPVAGAIPSPHALSAKDQTKNLAIDGAGRRRWTEG
jgi:hypothetical protein